MSGSIYSGIATTVPRAGVASITIDAEAVDIASDLVYDVTNIDRETLTGQSGVQDFKEKNKPGMISFVARTSPTFSAAAINLKRSSSVVVLLADGSVVAGNRMWSTKVEEVNTEEGTCKVTFEGRKVVKTR